jgi:hypothetical protein
VRNRMDSVMTPGGPGSIDQVMVDSDGTHYLVDFAAGGHQWYPADKVQDPPAYADTFGFPDALPSECAQPERRTHQADTHAARKARPLARGVLYYCPDALGEVAKLSAVGNDQHNPGEPMHWAKGKSTDHGDCILRHQADYDELDKDGVLHAVKVAWRALMQLQTFLEAQDPELAARRQAQRDRQARGER